MPGSISRLIRLAFHRLPFTLATLAALVLVALYTDTHVAGLTRRLLYRVGFAPRDLLLFNWNRIFLSALITQGGTVFWRVLGMVFLTVGAAEWLAGSGRTAATFWGIHLATLLVLSLLISMPLHLSGFSLGTDLMKARDVGPSAGFVGCLGLFSACLGRPWRWVSAGVILTVLTVLLMRPLHSGQAGIIRFVADLSHAVAFPLGWLSLSLGGMRLKPSPGDRPRGTATE